MSADTSVLELSKNCWCVELGGRMYRAEYVDNDEVFPLDPVASSQREPHETAPVG